MSAALTSPGSSACHQALQQAPAPGPGVGIHDNDELPPRLADAIDDRIAEIVDELLDERLAMRPQRRLLRPLGVLILVGALAASSLLRHSTLAAWTIWGSTAAACIAVAWTTKTGKPSRRPGDSL